MQFQVPTFSSTLVTHEREKLLNAVIYFVTNTKHCHTLKLFKLLFLLDFEHFRQTGRTVTGLEYKAWPNGPAPSELWQELSSPPEDLAAAVSIVPIHGDWSETLLRRDIKPKKKFDGKHFSKRELRTMALLAEIFDEAPAGDMSQFSHAKGSPWHQIFANGAGLGRSIPVELARHSPAVLPSLPSLSDEEYEYRKAVFAGVDGGNGG